ncbi:DUF992 domain-containing protein [Nordella sp. HKS 07]|uniref:DUF992 domain-containing protein n=1 Tax=Nordella sp. HKS 07 TaxID=2712222 RepID=UPI0013E10773|nr:DUF992 domain-containing protein [Nordella sp. HKS 07]QIG48797.1 DUF992 domain-containing protein [Nordella sp. HKS 07]
MKKWMISAGAVAIATALLAVSPASAKSGVKVGSLNCTVAGGVGLILGSSKSVKCRFTPIGGGKVERYTGSITKLGIDIGFTKKSYITWTVFAGGKTKPGALAGSYGGASAEATIGVGLGANVLVGGFKKTIALQPLSIQGQKGLNVAAGIAGLKLSYAGS